MDRIAESAANEGLRSSVTPAPTRDAQYGQLPVVLPVLDLLAGQVVHARGGRRDEYAPIQSPLVAGSAPQAVLAALLRCTGAQRAYLADLDAILGGAAQRALVTELLAAFPTVEFWLDAGFRTSAEALHALDAFGSQAQARLVAVLGSETLRGVEPLLATRCVLSLDFGADGFRGNPGWLTTPAAWPDRVIVMSLQRVGGQRGPDLVRLRQCRALAGQREVYAAGGVAGQDDLDDLSKMGVTGALVASALHFGTLVHPATR